MNSSLTKSSWVTLAALASTAMSLQASVLLYEGFGYGLANNASINGAAATGTGVQGNWTVTNTGTASSLYKTSDLSFGSNFATNGGGSLQLSATYNGSNSVSSATVNLSNTGTGTIWGSYLANFTTIGTANSGSFVSGVATGTNGVTSSLKSGVLSNTNDTDRKLSNGYDSTATPSGNFAFATSTTYLFVSRFTNVGTALGGGINGAGTTWALTQAQYESWLAGGATEAGLDSNFSVRVNDALVGSGTFAYDSNGYLVFRSDAPDNNGSAMTVTVDEVRFGTSVADIYAVPEPSTALLSLGAGLIWFSRRRRTA